MPENALLVNLAAMINQPLDGNLKSKILVIKTFPSRLVTALGLMLGSGVLLSGGSVLAANAYFAQPASPGGPGGIFSINFGALLVGDTITFGDKMVTPQSFLFGGTGSLLCEWIEGSNPGYADDFFKITVMFSPSLVGVKTGFLSYAIDVLDAGYQFDTVQIDSTLAINPGSPGQSSLVGQITGGPTLVSLDGASVGPIAVGLPTTIFVNDSWNVTAGDVLTRFDNTLTQVQVPEQVPHSGAFSVLGLGLVVLGINRKAPSQISAKR